MADLSFLPSIVFILLAAVLVVAVFMRFNLSPVLGYFVAGAAIGEHGWLSKKFPTLLMISSDETHIWAEFGVVFLLFAIGLELTLDRLKAMRVYVFGVGGLQVVITGVLIGLMVYLAYGGLLSSAVVIGLGVTMSSTAVVMQVLVEQRKQSTQPGRLALAILLMQDLAVVPLLVLIPLLSENSGSKFHALQLVTYAVAKAAAVLTVIFIAGRLLLRPLFRLIYMGQSKNNELFVATTMLIVLGAAWTTEHMKLSLALGAFIAGLLVAETEFHTQAEESIMPFKGLFLGLFFMTVGMSFEPQRMLDNLNTIIFLSLTLILIKAGVITALCTIFKFTLSNSIHTGLLLAQGGEFSFILFNMAMKQNIIPAETGHILMMSVTTTMALTPLLSIIGEAIAERLDQGHKMDYDQANKDSADLNRHVIIIGFGMVGKMVARVLEAEKVRYVAIDVDHTHVVLERKEGFPVYLGNGSKIDVLRTVGVERAQSIIITMESEVILRKCSKVIREHDRKIPIIVRAKDLSKDQELYKIGVTTIVPETYETGLQLGGAVLKSVGINEREISRIKNQFRAGNYVMAEDHGQEVLKDAQD